MPIGAYRTAHPESALLLVEVSASSLRKDRELKASIYARADVPEYWIVNVVDQCVERYTAPRNGSYTNVTVVRPGEILRPEGLEGLEIPATGILR